MTGITIYNNIFKKSIRGMCMEIRTVFVSCVVLILATILFYHCFFSDTTNRILKTFANRTIF